MKKVLFLLISLFLFVFAGCAHTQVKINSQSKQILQSTMIQTVGYLVAKHNPDLSAKLLKWYVSFQQIEKFDDFQSAYKEGVKYLMSRLVKDPYLQLQIRNAMDLIQVTVDGPRIPIEMKKYKSAVNDFMLGVEAAQSTNKLKSGDEKNERMENMASSSWNSCFGCG